MQSCCFACAHHLFLQILVEVVGSYWAFLIMLNLFFELFLLLFSLSDLYQILSGTQAIIFSSLFIIISGAEFCCNTNEMNKVFIWPLPLSLYTVEEADICTETEHRLMSWKHSLASGACQCCFPAVLCTEATVSSQCSPPQRGWALQQLLLAACADGIQIICTGNNQGCFVFIDALKHDLFMN